MPVYDDQWGLPAWESIRIRYGFHNTFAPETFGPADERLQEAINASECKADIHRAVDDLLEDMSTRESYSGEKVWNTACLVDMFLLGSCMPEEARKYLYTEMGACMFESVMDTLGERLDVPKYVADIVLFTAVKRYAEVAPKLSVLVEYLPRYPRIISCIVHAFTKGMSLLARALSDFAVFIPERKRDYILKYIAASEFHNDSVVQHVVHRILVAGGPRGAIPGSPSTMTYLEDEKRACLLWNMARDMRAVRGGRNELQDMLWANAIHVPLDVWMICISYLMCDNSRKLFRIRVH